MTDQINIINSNLKNNVGSTLGIDEELIKNLIYGFYSKVKDDDLIGPIFNKIILDNWDHHLLQMCDFWSSIALSTRRYKGQPFIKHINIANINKEHFTRWLNLFEENAYNICSKEIAKFFIDKAYKIAESLLLGIEFHNMK